MAKRRCVGSESRLLISLSDQGPLRDAADAAGEHSVLIVPLVGPPARPRRAPVLQRRATGE